MANDERFLLAIEGKDGAKLVLQFESEHFISGKMKAAKDLGMWCKRLSEEDMKSGQYDDAHIYDMAHHATSKIFFLEQWLHIFKMTNSDSA